MLKLWYRALTQDYLHGDAYVGRARISVFERPGLWMTGEQLAQLQADFRAVAAKAQPQCDMSYGVLGAGRERLGRSIVSVAYDVTTNQPIAFNALLSLDAELNHKSCPVLHMGLVVVDPTARQHGVVRAMYGIVCILALVRNRLQPLWASNLTQSPAILGMVTETFSDVFPSPVPGSRRSDEHLALAQQIVGRHGNVFSLGPDAAFDESRFVITNSYSKCSKHLKYTSDGAPKHRKAIYNDYCRNELDYDRGDDVLQLCKLDVAAIWRILRREPWPASFAVSSYISLCRMIFGLQDWHALSPGWGALRSIRRNGSGSAVRAIPPAST